MPRVSSSGPSVTRGSSGWLMIACARCVWGSTPPGETTSPVASGTRAPSVGSVPGCATQAALLDQERAGVDVLTTGEMMRVRFIIGFYEHLRGLRALAPPRKLGQ